MRQTQSRKKVDRAETATNLLSPGNRILQAGEQQWCRRHARCRYRTAAATTAALASEEQWLLTDLVLAECVYVLESFYEVPREALAAQMRAALALPSITTIDRPTLLRALEIYEIEHLDFAEAYLVAQAGATGVRQILTFDRSGDRIQTITRREP